MTALGAFRDDYYNATSVLTDAQSAAFTGTGASGAIPASSLAGAQDCYLVISGQTAAQTYTTDTATNIIAQIQTAVAQAYKTQIAGFSQSVNPPLGAPNLFNIGYALTINNQNTSTGTMTINGGTGVTMTGLAGLNFTTVAINTTVVCVVTITSPTSVTITRVQ